MRNYILSKLGLTESNTVLDFLIPRTEDYVKKYCGLDILPPALEVVCGNMICALYLDAADAQNIAQLKMGNVSATFAQTEADVYRQYRLVLNLYRKGLFE